MIKSSIVVLMTTLLLVFFLTAKGQYDEDNEEYEVPFVPTANEIVEQMLELANVSNQDMLYDLGCGDGRIVITAAKRYGARGVGIDINPIRIEESRENAKNEGVTDKVRFIEQDLFKADIRDGTVVTLYLLPGVNLRLRPILFQQLKPGSRIVSHNYDLGEWNPDQFKIIDQLYEEEHHTIYLWILPANVSGTWEWNGSSNKENKQYVLDLDQKFQQLNGILRYEGEEMTITELKITGNKIQMRTEEKNESQTKSRLFEGVVESNLITGTVVTYSGQTSNKTVWRAKRDHSTIKQIDLPPQNRKK